MYALLTMVLTIIPFVMHEFGAVYFGAALALNLVLAWRVLRLFQVVRRGETIDKVTALPLYKYSMTYLALLFLTMALDRMFFL
jgi:protoheme IX farnesyltransferase